MSKITPLARKTEIVVQDLGNELLIYDLKSNKALSLNQTSALIWQLSTGEKNIDEIAEETSKKFKTKVNDEFIWLALWRLKKENLIETEISDSYKGFGRREMIKKIGLASLITLPVITSLVAPTALQAQSGGCSGGGLIPDGCPCSGIPESCATGCCGAPTSASTSRVCVPARSEAPGAFCRSFCECSGGCCGFGPTSPVCVDCGSVAPGNRCRSNPECFSVNCSNFVSPGVVTCV